MCNVRSKPMLHKCEIANERLFLVPTPREVLFNCPKNKLLASQVTHSFTHSFLTVFLLILLPTVHFCTGAHLGPWRIDPYTHPGME